MRFQPPWGGAFRLQTFFHRTPEALAPDTVEAMRSAILGSELLGENHLTSQFSGTYGFSLTFRREGLAGVTERFAAFAPFLDAALLPACNAFLLNPLLVSNGPGVDTHLDRSLGHYDVSIGNPVAVSVLYIQVPQALTGGALRLYHRGVRVASLQPLPRALVTFRGDLAHEVAPIEGGAPEMAQARISLVVEQYRVAEPLLDRLPRLEVRTRTGVVS